MESKNSIKQVTVDFIEQYHDDELAGRIFDAAMKEAMNGGASGDTKKTLCALAQATSKFLRMCSELTKTETKENVKTADFFEPYTDVLDFYCFAADNPVNDDVL